MRCKPRGFFTKGKGPNRVVHPICGRGMGTAHFIERAAKAQTFAQRHGLKTGPAIMVPKLETFKSKAKELGPIPRPRRAKLAPVQRQIRKREARLEKKLKGESGLNMRVTGVLARRFPGRLSLILEQANAAYHYRNPGLEINPEPYELSEGGFIDEALDSLGLPHVATVGS